MIAKCKKCGAIIIRLTKPGEDKRNVLCEICQLGQTKVVGIGGE